jgi:hypothetical protein
MGPSVVEHDSQILVTGGSGFLAGQVILRRPIDGHRPAREGTDRVLRAAADADVRRVVMTSSFAAVGYSPKRSGEPYDETDPSTPQSPYVKSKTLAERDAWEFAATNDVELTVGATGNPWAALAATGASIATTVNESVAFVRHAVSEPIPVVPASTARAATATATAPSSTPRVRTSTTKPRYCPELRSTNHQGRHRRSFRSANFRHSHGHRQQQRQARRVDQHGRPHRRGDGRQARQGRSLRLRSSRHDPDRTALRIREVTLPGTATRPVG